jgi:hypothetical protein
MCRILPDDVKCKNATPRDIDCRQGRQGSLHCPRPTVDEEQAAAKIPDVTGDIGGENPAVHAESVPHVMGIVTFSSEGGPMMTIALTACGGVSILIAAQES